MSSTLPHWNIAPEELYCTAQDVHVWRANLAVPMSIVEQFRQVLSPEEKARAQRFYFDKDRHRWTVARGVLRTLLGRYTDTDPRELRFAFNTYGKPALTYPEQNPPLQFNLSHSGDLALYAFTRQRDIGVDVEYMRTTIEYDDIAKYSFSPREQTLLYHLSAEVKHQAFYNCWTRKEAYIKARGMGLSLSLGLFDVSLLPGEPAELLGSRENPQEMHRWTMQELAPGTGYAGALAVEGSGWHLHCWQWLDEYVSWIVLP